MKIFFLLIAIDFAIEAFDFMPLNASNYLINSNSCSAINLILNYLSFKLEYIFMYYFAHLLIFYHFN